MTINYRTLFYSFLALLIVISVGCSTSKNVRKKEANTFGTDTSGVEQKNVTELQKMLNSTRSKLSDVYGTQRQDMPKAFLKKSSSNESINSDPFDGYRIQIISTRDVQLADSVANQFRMWSDTTIAGYSAKAYVFFKQPFYKVHVGDFHQRNMADDFTKLVKRNYPDAWVVHDRIDPSDVPADTASFSIMKPGDRKKTRTDSLGKNIPRN